MGNLIVWLSLFCVLSTAHGGSPDCIGEQPGIPTDFTKLNGLWNLAALATSVVEKKYSEIGYQYAKLSINEEEANLTIYHNPIEEPDWEFFVYKRIQDHPSGLRVYQLQAAEKEVYTAIVIQPNDDSLILYERVNNELRYALIHSKGPSLPEAELESFKQWSQCNKLNYAKAFHFSINPAHECPELLHRSDCVTDKEDSLSWGLVAKSSSSADPHYLVRILYTARLEISRKGNEYTVREIQTAAGEKTLLELKYEKGVTKGVRLLTFETEEEDLLLLGIQTEAGRTLYLASKTSTARESVLEKFEKQAECFETEHVYFVPGGKEEDPFKKHATPLALKQALGTWNLVVSAYKKTEHALHDISVVHSWMELYYENDKLHVYFSLILEEVMHTYVHEITEVEEKGDHIILKESRHKVTSTLYGFSPDCIIFTAQIPNRIEEMLTLFCRSTSPAAADIKKFAEYSEYEKLNHLIIRSHSSFPCLDVPSEVKSLDLNKISGKWNVLAVATGANITKDDIHKVQEIHYDVHNGKVTVSEKEGATVTAEKSEDRRLRSTDAHSDYEMRFYGPIGDTMIILIGHKGKSGGFLVLLSKSDHVEPADIEKLKHFASCLKLHVVFQKE